MTAKTDRELLELACKLGMAVDFSTATACIGPDISICEGGYRDAAAARRAIVRAAAALASKEQDMSDQVQAPAEGDVLRKALERAREDINWMLNSRQLLNRFVFDYIDEALGEQSQPQPKRSEYAKLDRLRHECETHAWSANTIPCPDCAAQAPAPARPNAQAVAWWLTGSSHVEVTEKRDYHDGPEWTPLFSAPAPALLTDKQKGDRWRELLPQAGKFTSADWFEAGADLAESALRAAVLSPAVQASAIGEAKP